MSDRPAIQLMERRAGSRRPQINFGGSDDFELPADADSHVLGHLQPVGSTAIDPGARPAGEISRDELPDDVTGGVMQVPDDPGFWTSVAREFGHAAVPDMFRRHRGIDEIPPSGDPRGGGGGGAVGGIAGGFARFLPAILRPEFLGPLIADHAAEQAQRTKDETGSDAAAIGTGVVRGLSELLGFKLAGGVFGTRAKKNIGDLIMKGDTQQAAAAIGNMAGATGSFALTSEIGLILDEAQQAALVEERSFEEAWDRILAQTPETLIHGAISGFVIGGGGAVHSAIRSSQLRSGLRNYLDMTVDAVTTGKHPSGRPLTPAEQTQMMRALDTYAQAAREQGWRDISDKVQIFKRTPEGRRATERAESEPVGERAIVRREQPRPEPTPPAAARPQEVQRGEVREETAAKEQPKAAEATEEISTPQAAEAVEIPTRLSDLRQMAESMGLDSSGTRAEVRERIAEARERTADADALSPVSESEATVPPTRDDATGPHASDPSPTGRESSSPQRSTPATEGKQQPVQESTDATAEAKTQEPLKVGDRLTLPPYTGAPGSGVNYGNITNAEIVRATPKFVFVKSGEQTVRIPLDVAQAAREASSQQPPPTGATPAAKSAIKKTLPERRGMAAIGAALKTPPKGVTPGRRIDSHIANVAMLRGTFESASDRLIRNGFEKEGEAVRRYYDLTFARSGEMSAVMRPAMKEYQSFWKTNPARRKRVGEQFKQIMAHRERGRKAEADAALANADPITKKIISAWERVADQTGRENVAVGVEVQTPSGKWRKIGKLGKDFWPRTYRDNVAQAMQDPMVNPVLWNKMVDALIADKHIKDAAEAGKYLRRYLGEDAANDYFAGVERARLQPLPEMFYDYSINAALDYIPRWANRVSQIEMFGQKRGKDGKDLFDDAISRTQDKRTVDYLRATQERVYGVMPNEPWIKAMGLLNINATGLHLGNPATATRNLVAGDFLNLLTGVPRVPAMWAKTLLELRRMSKNLDDAIAKGVLTRDYMSIAADIENAHVTAGRLDVTGGALKVTDFLMKWGGYHPTETIIRVHGALIGREFVRSFLKQSNKGRTTGLLKRQLAWMQKEKIDADKIIAENGHGPESDALVRRVSNIPQGTYKIDQAPIWSDTPVGRIAAKYRKFHTQVMRMLWRHTFKPFLQTITMKGEKVTLPSKERQRLYQMMREQNPDLRLIDIPKTVPVETARAWRFGQMFTFMVGATLGGEMVQQVMRAMFGWQPQGPEWDEIAEALKDKDVASAVLMSMERAGHNMMAMGAVGVLGVWGYAAAQWLRGRERFDGTVPAWSVVRDAIINPTEQLIQQGKLSKSDINNIAKSVVGAYRNYEKLAQGGLNWVNADIDATKREAARREDNWARKRVRMWAEKSEDGDDRILRPSMRDFQRTPQTPFNRDVHDAVRVGNTAHAKNLIESHVSGMSKDDKEAAMRSLRASLSARHPYNARGVLSEKNRKMMLDWHKDRMSAEQYERLKRIGDEYDENFRKVFPPSRRGRVLVP